VDSARLDLLESDNRIQAINETMLIGAERQEVVVVTPLLFGDRLVIGRGAWTLAPHVCDIGFHLPQAPIGQGPLVRGTCNDCTNRELLVGEAVANAVGD